jgi:multisubunit Na+/H+ antiporter MnhF subunit
LRFVWFWTFWHWSTESFRSAALLRSPLQGVASHWDEWYQHEADENERKAIDAVGGSVFEQRRFVCWLARHWAREARWRDEQLPGRFVLAQLSRVAPFDKWTAFDKYRTTYAAPGIAAIVLNEESAGEAADVRPVEAIALPLDDDAAAGTVVADGFQIDSGDLSTARRAALSLLGGKGLLIFLSLWTLIGERPYPRYLRVLLAAGWIAVVALMARLLVGPDPGDQLVTLEAVLFALWSLLVVTSLATAGALAFKAWLMGRELRKRMATLQLRLRMNGGLSVHGGSAGLAFCLNDLLAVYRSHPRIGNRSWLWERFFVRLRGASETWAATGIVSAEGKVDHVVLEPKIRACLRNPAITDILTPWQPEARQSLIDAAAATTKPVRRSATGGEMVYAFASGPRKMRGHRCRHAAQSIIAIGDFTSKSQLTANILALAVTVVMALALPDIRNVLQPPAPPRAVAPGSPSPYYLWVSLDTERPEAFRAALESGFWSNRRADVFSYGGADGSSRAEMRLSRHPRQTSIDERDGVVWIERRRTFLGREFQPGERVGSYPLSYLTNIRGE